MLKRITVSDLEIGMFVHKMEGSWFSHPFWKAKFLIDDSEKLATLRSSSLEGVVIDTDKGRDVGEAGPRDAGHRPGQVNNSAPRPDSRIRKMTARAASTTDPTPTHVEVHTAQALAMRAQKTVHNTFIAARLGKAINVKAVQPVVADIMDSVRRNPQAFGGLMRCKLKNEAVYQHALSVSALMVALGRHMKLSSTEVHEAGLAGLLLDIGTNYLPQSAETASGDIRTADPKIWQQHVLLGHRALLNDGNLPDSVLAACLEHHERMDGTGFPKGLKRGEISTIGCMAAVCDSFDFLLTRSNSAGALDPAVAVQRLKQMEGAFDDDILRAFIESVGLYPVGSFVELASGKVGMVIDEYPADANRPVVQAFFSRQTGERIVPHRIELARADSQDAIIGIAELADCGLPDEAQLRELIFLTAYKLAI
ncbi:HD-GYP domain-containing protein [Porphyrobacter sp. AAP60]|uniref:HD-GYP domain-containing protein n=1 Tax=Porphyrobacter sp. AAP60 TaxID=1523423 RepID=UPI0006B8EA07|nr:DUF3391 domain-containing protein [Porphyrobacter sp. AAP60]KPF61656.1 hypothetical protein IP79_15080 [Porphyrobacter sp. AAP60]